MQTIRFRFAVIDKLKESQIEPFFKAETAAFHGRKILEGIAFACLIAIKNGLQIVPRDVKGQWNAEDIFKRLKAKGLVLLPNPSYLRPASQEEHNSFHVKAVIEGMPDKCLTHEELIEIYRRFHKWLHEINPGTSHKFSYICAQNAGRLWKDLESLWFLLEKHTISIHGELFFCLLCDSQDQQTKVGSFSKIASLVKEIEV